MHCRWVKRRGKRLTRGLSSFMNAQAGQGNSESHETGHKHTHTPYTHTHTNEDVRGAWHISWTVGVMIISRNPLPRRGSNFCWHACWLLFLWLGHCLCWFDVNFWHFIWRKIDKHLTAATNIFIYLNSSVVSTLFSSFIFVSLAKMGYLTRLCCGWSASNWRKATFCTISFNWYNAWWNQQHLKQSTRTIKKAQQFLFDISPYV